MIKVYLSIALAMLVVSGCATVDTTVYPEGKNHYQVVATSSQEVKARDGALEEAKKVCTESSKLVKVDDVNTSYQGVDKNTGAVMDLVSNLAFATNGLALGSSRKTNDYKTVLAFDCV